MYKHTYRGMEKLNAVELMELEEQARDVAKKNSTERERAVVELVLSRIQIAEVRR